MHQQGTVFNIQRFSTDDGSGIRTCVFLKGCPLKCQWCHNAEGLSFTPEIAVYSHNCIGCASCITACPNGALELRDCKIEINRAKCLSCGCCTEACPAGTLVTVGSRKTINEVMAAVHRDKVFYRENGGLTITGGEPMAQPRFTLALAEAAKNEGISVAVETSGYGNEQDFLDLTPFCDVFLFDCKASGQQHKALIGVEDDLILHNMNAVTKAGGKIILRCPIIANANLNQGFLHKIISLAQKYDSIQAVQLMPYHATGAEKSTILGKEAQPTFERPNDEILKTLTTEIEKQSGKICYY